MSFKIAAVAVTAAGLICGQAVAQNVTTPHLANLQGLVYVDQGDGFYPASASTVLHPGDRVMTGRGGVAKISYSGGCGQQVDARSMTVIGSAGCGGGSAQIIKTDYQDDAGGGMAGGGGFGGVSTTGLIIGGVALAGIVAVIVGAATDNGNNNGSSGGTSGGGTGPVSP